MPMKSNGKQGRLKKLLDGYAQFVAHRKFIILLIILLFTIFTGYYASKMETVGTSQEDFLPEDIEVVKVFDLISDQFGGSMKSATIVVETAPHYANSNEIRDMRDPEIIRYVDMLERRAELIHGVTGAESAADVIKQANGGRIPSSLRSVKLLLRENDVARNQIRNYISDDCSMTIVKLHILKDVDSEEITNELKELTRGDKPAGVEVKVTDNPVLEYTARKLAHETMGSTSLLSFALIVVILVAIFTSIRYGLIPLSTIVFGTIWTYGILTLVGFEITPQTSGVMAMIMGIGIDFGIQVTKRFRYELGSHQKEQAMTNTLTSVLYPMFITTLAAVIGFKCLSLAKLPMMADMGTMMAAGVVFCMLAAITAVPVLLLLFERSKGQTNNTSKVPE